MREAHERDACQEDDVHHENDTLHGIEASLSAYTEEAGRYRPHSSERVNNEASHKDIEKLLTDVCDLVHTSILGDINRVVSSHLGVTRYFVSELFVLPVAQHGKVCEVANEYDTQRELCSIPPKVHLLASRSLHLVVSLLFP